MRVPSWIERISQRCVVVCRNEVRKLVVSLKGVRQPVETKTEVESQPGNDVPVVKNVEAIVVLDPMFAREELELGEGRGIAEEEVDIRILGKRTVVEYRGALSVGLQFLVLRSVQPAKAEFELVHSLVP